MWMYPFLMTAVVLFFMRQQGAYFVRAHSYGACKDFSCNDAVMEGGYLWSANCSVDLTITMLVKTAMITSLQFAHPEKQLTLDYLETFAVPDGNRHVIHCNDLQIGSHFQPVYSLAHQRMVGAEALARPALAARGPISPQALFSSANSLEEIIFLDRLCRMLHVRNFMRQADDNSWLFLNLNPLVTLYGRKFGSFFGQLLERYGIPPHRIVIEILEGQIDDEGLLAESIGYYRDIGCLIAIDDFGVGHSNFDRIWRIAPHIVKFDKTVIEQAANNRSVRRVLPGLVALIHEAGSLALMEGIETEDQALLAMQAGMDFVQGFFFSQPQRNLPGFLFHSAIGHLFERLRQGNVMEELVSKRKLGLYQQAFFEAIMKVRSGGSLPDVLQPFLALPAVNRCYILDEQGVQVGQNFSAGLVTAEEDPRFAPLSDARNAIWARRHYFQRAIVEPGRIQTSKPYLSIAGGSLCVTLSIAINTADGLRVVCGDIAWDDSEVETLGYVAATG